jgi:Cdc6-like AAA superfamily ATPase
MARILLHHLRGARFPTPVEPDALTRITDATTNISLGLHWLAATADEDRVTPAVLEAARENAVQRYRTALLADFTPHHERVLTAIDQLTETDERVFTGAVYDRYAALCRTSGQRPLTPRRISDFLTHLELLGLIDVTHHDGGPQGKTRELRPAYLEEL